MDTIVRLFQGATVSGEDRRRGEQEDDGVETPPREEPPSEQEKDPTLYFAIAAREWDKAETLLNAGTGLRYKKLNGCTVLHLAVQRSAPSHIIEKIIDSGMDVNVTDALALNTPLHYALREDAPVDVIRTLLRKGADVNRRSIGSLTPLALGADSNCSVAAMALALDHGARTDVFDELRWTPLHWAVRKNANPALVRLLLERGSNPNAKHPVDVSSILQYAMANKVSDSNLRLLLCFGAEIDPSALAKLPEESTARYNRIFKKAGIMLVLCAPVTIPRMIRGRSPLRMLPTDVLRTLSIFLFGKVAA